MVQLTYVWFRQWLGNILVTSHYLNQWWQDFCCYMVSPGLNELTHQGLVMPNGRSGSTLPQVMAHFLMGTKPLPESVFINLSVRSCGLQTEGNRVSQEILRISILDMNLKINDIRLQPHLPCANDLRYFWPADQGGNPVLMSGDPMLWAHNMNHFNNLSLWCLVVTS